MQRLIDCSDTSESARIGRLEQLIAGYHHFLAHDLANQLVAVQGFARLLTEQTAESDPESRALLTRLADLARRADQQARRFAEYGRLLREPPGGPPVPLAEVAAEAVAEVRAAPRTSPATAVGISFDVVQLQGTVSLSRRLLLRVLTELLHNCVAARAARVAVSVEEDQGRWLVVQDDGAGLAEPVLAKLGTPGTGGLGWFFIRQAVATWHGRASVGTEPGRGTKVLLLLPIHEA
jgi:signal transduction histidine kinase